MRQHFGRRRRPERGENRLKAIRVNPVGARHSKHDAEHGAVRASINDVANHIEHVRDVAGIDHVGIRSDYWGMADMPVGLEDVSGFPRLFAVLIQRGWSDDELRKLAGGDMLRVMRRVENVGVQTE